MSTYIIDATMRLKDKLTEPLKKAQSTINNNTKTINRFAKNLNSAGKSITSLGKTLTSAITLPLTALGTTSVVSFANFEAAMLGVKNVTNSAAEELKTLEQLALNMSTATSKSAIECANGIEYLGLAGWSVSEIMDNYEEVLRLSEATSIDLATASDLLTDSLSAYGKSADFTTEYLNKLTLMSTKANANTQQLLESIVACGGMAKNLGLNIDELSATLGILANRGIKGAEAGTSLNSIFVNLLGTTSTTRKALDQLGVAVYDTQGQFVGWENLLNKLSTAMASCTNEQRDMLSAALGGKTQLDTLLALLDGYTNEYKDLVQSMGSIYVTDEFGNQLTILEQMQQDYQNTLLGQFEILKSQVSYIFIKVGNAINKTFGSALEKVSEKVSKFINWCQSLTDEQKKSYIMWGAIAAAIGPLALIIGKVTTGIASGIKSFVSFNKAIQTAGGFMKLLKSPMGFLQLKILLIAGAIIGLIAVGIYLKNNWEKLIPVFKTVGAIIAGVLALITIHFIALNIQSIITFVTMAAQALITAVAGVGLLIAGAIIGIVAVLVYLFKNWTQIWQGIQDFFITIWENISSYFVERLNSIKQFFIEIWESIKEYYISWFEAISAIFNGIIEFIVGVFTGNWASAWEGVKAVFSGIWDGLVVCAKTPLNMVISLINHVIRGINSLASFSMPSFLGGKEITLFTIPELPKLYKGSNYWTGGTAMIHDKGAEIVDLPNGSRVYPHDESLKMSYEEGVKSGVGQNITINIATVTVREEADINKIAKKLAQELEKTSFNMV